MMARAVLSAFTLTPGSSPGQALGSRLRGNDGEREGEGTACSVFLWVPAPVSGYGAGPAGKTVGVGVEGAADSVVFQRRGRLWLGWRGYGVSDGVSLFRCRGFSNHG